MIHTPIPWRIMEGSHHTIFNSENKPMRIYENDNAAFIVKACNNHDSLVEALELCEDIIGKARLQGKLSDNPLSPVNDALIKARKVLDKVGVK